MTRKEAIDNLKADIKYWENTSVSTEHLCMAVKALEQEPKKGHWIMTHDYFTGAYESIDCVECSCCHADSLEEGNYCPYCGAEMESEE